MTSLHNGSIIFLLLKIGGVIIKEYGIYIQQGTGSPYMIHIYNNIDSAKSMLYQMIQLEEDRRRPYYVDNDFYKNKYGLVSNVKYMRIKVRDVSDWETYSEEEIEKEENKSNIVYLNNYKVF